MRIAYRSLAVAYALAFFTLHANAQNEPFPRPAELEPAVKFWTRVYTEIDTSEGFIHDSWRMDIVYQTVHTGDLGTRERRRRIERAESWLKQHPGDAALLLTLGRLCADRALWGKAQSYLDASLAIEPTYSAHLAAATGCTRSSSTATAWPRGSKAARFG